MRWSVEIRSTGLERRNLVDLLAELGFNLVSGDSTDEFTSPKMDGCRTPQEVFEMAKGARRALTGASGVDPEFELGKVVDYSTSPALRHVFLEPNSAKASVTVGRPTLEIGPPSGLTESELEAWECQRSEEQYQNKLERQLARLVPAYKSEAAEKVLDLLSRPEPTGETVYKIYELMEGGPNMRSTFHQKYNISKDEFDRFRDAVHDPSVSGEWARHSVGQGPRTGNPMTPREAMTFVKRIVKTWMEDIHIGGK